MFRSPKAVLSGKEIAEAVARQHEFELLNDTAAVGCLCPWGSARRWWLRRQPRIHIDGFTTKPTHEGGRLGPNSYDCSLHPELLVYDVKRLPDNLASSPQFDGWSEYALDMAKDNPVRKLTIPNDGLILKPGRLYLGRTVERTETYNLVPYIDGRSSIGRLGLLVHFTAGAGDCAYQGTWTLELACIHPLRIYPYTKICQLSYSPISFGGGDYKGRYQNTTDATSCRLHIDSKAS